MRRLRWDGALLLAAMAAAVAPNWLAGTWLLGPLAVILVALASSARRGGVGPFAVLGLGALFVSLALSAPYVMVGAVAVYGLAALTWPPARAAGVTPGRAKVADVVAALGTGAAAGAVLAVWLLLARPDVSDLVSRIPRVGWPALILIALLFALVNSVVEEVLFRGLLWAALAESLRSGASIVIAQAACFGAAHYHGFPRGGSGVALAAA